MLLEKLKRDVLEYSQKVFPGVLAVYCKRKSLEEKASGSGNVEVRRDRPTVGPVGRFGL